MNASWKADLNPYQEYQFTVTWSRKSFGKEENGKTAPAKIIFFKEPQNC